MNCEHIRFTESSYVTTEVIHQAIKCDDCDATLVEWKKGQGRKEYWDVRNKLYENLERDKTITKKNLK